MNAFVSLTFHCRIHFDSCLLHVISKGCHNKNISHSLFFTQICMTYGEDDLRYHISAKVSSRCSWVVHLSHPQQAAGRAHSIVYPTLMEYKRRKVREHNIEFGINLSLFKLCRPVENCEAQIYAVDSYLD